MFIRIVIAVALAAVPFVALPVSAGCEVATVEELGQTNFVTVCVLEEGTHADDGTQRTEHDYLAHVTTTVDVDPVLTHSYVRTDREHWTYDDEESGVHLDRRSNHVGAGNMENVADLVGTGFQANVIQRDQNAPEAEGEGMCSSWTGRSTCAGASAWFTVNGVASFGAGAYDAQAVGDGGCTENVNGGVDVGGIVFVPFDTGFGPCLVELPWLDDTGAWDTVLP